MEESTWAKEDVLGMETGARPEVVVLQKEERRISTALFVQGLRPRTVEEIGA
jgi:hypothetical protein